MIVLLETLCGYSREFEVPNSLQDEPPREIRLAIMERLTIRQRFKPEEKFEVRHRTFEFAYKKKNGLWYYIEKWEKAK